MTRTEKIADSLLKPINPSVIIILGVYTILWGLWIVSPYWTVFTQAPLFGAMDSIAPEYVWGLIAVAAGCVISHGALKPRYRNIQWGSFVAFFHWFIIAILYFAGDWQNTGGITALAFALYSGLVWVNIKVNKGHYE